MDPSLSSSTDHGARTVSAAVPQVRATSRSGRTIKVRRAYSPELVLPAESSSTTTKRIPGRTKMHGHPPKSDKLVCDRCKSVFVPPPRHRRFLRPNCKRNTKSQLENLCNACRLGGQGTKGTKRLEPSTLPSPEDKEKYLENARTFAQSLVEALNDQDAERLYCPDFRVRPCACIQQWVISGAEWEEMMRRSRTLLHLLKEAKALSRQKYYKADEVMSLNGNRKGKRVRHIGLGNGQKRSKAFEQFVLAQRRYLREEIGICERATQRVLVYSNNFLHKKLKTEPEKDRRVDRKKGKAAMGLLKPIEKLASEPCCQENCVLMADTHAFALKCWRERAAMGQAEARRVLAEMLTPAAGDHQNCYKFISMVTGCSYTTIGRVSEQMRLSGGDREPPEHGLKRFWQEQVKNQTRDSQNERSLSNVESAGVPHDEGGSCSDVLTNSDHQRDSVLFQGGKEPQGSNEMLMTSPSSDDPMTLVQPSANYTSLSLTEQKTVHQIILNGINSEPMTVQLLNSGLGNVLVIQGGATGVHVPERVVPWSSLSGSTSEQLQHQVLAVTEEDDATEAMAELLTTS